MKKKTEITFYIIVALIYFSIASVAVWYLSADINAIIIFVIIHNLILCGLNSAFAVALISECRNPKPIKSDDWLKLVTFCGNLLSILLVLHYFYVIYMVIVIIYSPGKWF